MLWPEAPTLFLLCLCVGQRPFCFFALNLCISGDWPEATCVLLWQLKFKVEEGKLGTILGRALMSVKAIANIPLGESLQRRLDQNKKLALHNSSNFRALSENAKKKSLWYRDERPRWLGPIPYDYPPYLTGELPGDYGFDIAALAKDPTSLSEAFHFAEPIWWRVGYSKLKKVSLICLVIAMVRGILIGLFLPVKVVMVLVF
ncbi:hypothetical protein UlMin_041630 [Ulmus minor]